MCVQRTKTVLGAAEGAMKKRTSILRSNVHFARTTWGQLPETAICALKKLTKEHALSVADGDLQFLDGRWYVTHTGLLRIALRSRCLGIRTAVQERFSNPAANRWVFKAVIHKSAGSKGFVGYGDADPSNVSPLVHGAEMRVAETRAVNRATERHSGNGQPRLRDRLCQLIRQHRLDPTLVKLYAADYCGTAVLREASRDLVEAFINNLAEWAAKDRKGLLCHLNSYAQPKEASS